MQQVDSPLTTSLENRKTKYIAAFVSEVTGSFVLVFLFMICTDKKTQFSQDKVVNCFIVASSYCSARLMAGGTLVTGIELAGFNTYNYVGPLLNPALAFGQCLLSWTFRYTLQYIVAPFAGSALALVFYEFVFVRSQEYMADDEEEEEEEGGL